MKRRSPIRRWLAIAAAAVAWSCGGGDGAPARPGEFDRLFGTDGIATLEGGPFEGASASARFAVAGPGPGLVRAGGNVRRSSVHARLNPEGVPDINFAGSGYLLLPPQPTDFPLDDSREGIAAFGRPDGSEMLVDRVHVPCVTGPSCAISGGGYDAAAVRVQTKDGLIHRVVPGNHLGQNDGRITSVSDVRIALVEIVPDGMGGYIERQAALALSD